MSAQRFTTASLHLLDPQLEPIQRPLDHYRNWFQVDESVASKLETVCAGPLDDWPILLTGPAGSGKTCAALALLDRASGGYKALPDLCADLVDWQMTDQRERIRQFWHYWPMYYLAVLDELGGRQTVSDHHYETLKRCLDLREDKPLVCISNLPLDDLARLYDDRVASRLGAGTVIALAGRDRRIDRGPA